MKRKGKSHAEYLARFARGELSAEEQQQWQALPPEEQEKARLLQQFVEKEAQTSPQFTPFFVGKVMQAIRPPQESIPAYLPTAFRWIATPALALIVGSIFYIGYQEGGVSLDILMGLEDLSVNDLLYDALATSD